MDPGKSRRASIRPSKISRQISLWNQRGAQVLLGTLMVIPIKAGLSEDFGSVPAADLALYGKVLTVAVAVAIAISLWWYLRRKNRRPNYS